MKHYILLFTIVLMQSAVVQAQDFDLEKNNYLVLSKNIKQLEPILQTAIELKIEDGRSFGDFIVIICGSTVQDIPENNSFEKLLKEAQNNRIAIYGCGLSLDKFNVNIQKLPKNLLITKNGILFGFQLAKKGFVPLTI